MSLKDYQQCEDEDPTEEALKSWEYVMNTCRSCDAEIPSFQDLCEACKAREEASTK